MFVWSTSIIEELGFEEHTLQGLLQKEQTNCCKAASKIKRNFTTFSKLFCSISCIIPKTCSFCKWSLFWDNFNCMPLFRVFQGLVVQQFAFNIIM